MNVRYIITAVVLVTATFAARAADEENPYKNVKVGDFATYAMENKVDTVVYTTTVTHTVIKKDDKEVTIMLTGTLRLNGKEAELPAQERKIDLTKPFDPNKAGNLTGGLDAKVEKEKEGKEKIKVGDKTYETTWTTYKLTTKVKGQNIDADVKVWFTKDVPVWSVKLSMTSVIGGKKVEVTQELKETGYKKPND